MPKQMVYNGENYYIHVTTYVDKVPCIILHPSHDLYHSPEQIVVSVNLTKDLEKGTIAIRLEEPYEQALETLVKAEVVSEPIEYVKQGYSTYAVCRLLDSQTS
jgi:hypothetical protein